MIEERNCGLQAARSSSLPQRWQLSVSVLLQYITHFVMMSQTETYYSNIKKVNNSMTGRDWTEPSISQQDYFFVVSGSFQLLWVRLIFKASIYFEYISLVHVRSRSVFLDFLQHYLFIRIIEIFLWCFYCVLWIWMATYHYLGGLDMYNQ